MSDADPPAVTVVREDGTSPIVLLCEHASNYIPPRYNKLGLSDADLARHIAYDIGAAEVAHALSRRLDAPLLLSGYSRLLIDCNRPLTAPSSIPTRSEATLIPGNISIDADERARRDALCFAPFRNRVAGMLDARLRAARPTLLIGMHSFTPVFLGAARPWHAGFLFRTAAEFGRALVALLAEQDAALVVGENEPYQVTLDTDFTVPYQGDVRGIPAALIEVRQDLIADAAGQGEWAERLGRVLHSVADNTRTFTEAQGAAHEG